MTSEEIRENADPEAIVWDDFDAAMIGTDTVGRIVYDINKMIDILIVRDEMELSDAIEYLEFNVLCAYVGEFTPIHVYTEII